MWRMHGRALAAAAMVSLPLCLLHGDAARAGVPASHRMQSLPRVTVWAWERREDLRALDPATTAVAYLDRTIVLDGRGVVIEPRRQPMLLPASSALVRIPVVRVETGRGAVLDERAAEVAAQRIVEAAQPGVSALQIDFDAVVSERAWYRGMLERVRRGLPPELPLSITALASWCSYDGGWLRDLPVDEAVPMLFRMEPDRRSFAPNQTQSTPKEFVLRAPLCAGSVGISTREAWPREMAGRRVYVFPDRGWQRDGLTETVRELE